MRIYQKIIILILLVIGGAFFYAQKAEEIKSGAKNILKNANLLTVCDQTLYYSLGEIDSRFEISQEEVLEILAQSEEVWEQDLHKNVFEYREGADFKINFIFDERQQGTIEKANLDGKLDELDAHKENISKEYQTVKLRYQQAVAIYEKNLKNYENEVEDFNNEIDNWKKEGGAPKDEYEKLKKEEKKLEEMKDRLEFERKNINKLVAQLNELVSKEKKVVNNYSSQIETYRERFGESREFNQGEYSGMGINIYQFHENNDLELVLVHELGHALELDHVENPESIMYYLMEKQDLENIKLSNEDIAAIKGVCKLK